MSILFFNIKNSSIVVSYLGFPQNNGINDANCFDKPNLQQSPLPRRCCLLVTSSNWCQDCCRTITTPKLDSAWNAIISYYILCFKNMFYQLYCTFMCLFRISATSACDHHQLQKLEFVMPEYVVPRYSSFRLFVRA